MGLGRFKDRGFYHWLIVLCCCGMITGSLGISVNSSGVYYSPVAEDLGVGRGDVAMYITIMNLMTGLVGPFIIRLSRKTNLRAMIGIGGLLASLCLASWSYAASLWQLYVAAFLHGIGNAMYGTVVINLVIGNWFYKSAGLAMGWSLSSSGIAGAILSPMLQGLINGYGWRISHLFAAGITTLTLMPALFFVRAKPQEAGLLPFGATEKGDEKATKDFSCDKNHDVIKLRMVYTVIVCFVGFIGAFLTGMGQHMSGYASSIGLTASIGALIISATMIGNMSSKILLGALCDKIGSAKAFLLFLGLTACGFIGLSFISGTNLVILTTAAFLLGFSYSLGGLGMSQITRVIFGKQEFGKVYAYVASAGMIGSSFASSLIGYSYDLFGTYRIATYTCTGLILLAAAILVWMFKSTSAFSRR